MTAELSTQPDTEPPTPPTTPPSLRPGSGGSRTTASSLSKHEDLLDMLDLIFVPEVSDKIYSRSQARSSIKSATLHHIQVQSHTQEFGDQTTARDRLAHYGINQPTRLRNSRFVRLLLGPPSPACTELAYIHELAKRYSQNNYASVSFGQLLYRYLLLYVLDSAWVNEVKLIGGEDTSFIPGDHSTQHEVPHPDDTTITFTLHWVRGNHLVNSGQGPVRDRVKDDYDAKFNDNSVLWLYHGTNIESASNIMLNGPSLEFSAHMADFGQGFYLTNNFKFCLGHAYEVTKGDGLTVLAFPVQCNALHGKNTGFDILKLPESTDTEEDDWKRVVVRGRRGLWMPKSNLELKKKYNYAACVIGQIAKNPEEIDKGSRPMALSVASYGLQYAFNDLTLDVLNDLIRNGKVHVIRVAAVNQEVCVPTVPQGGGPRGGGRRRRR